MGKEYVLKQHVKIDLCQITYTRKEKAVNDENCVALVAAIVNRLSEKRYIIIL